MRRLYVSMAAVLLASTLLALAMGGAGADSGATKRYGAMVARASFTSGTIAPTLTVVAVK